MRLTKRTAVQRRDVYLELLDAGFLTKIEDGLLPRILRHFDLEDLTLVQDDSQLGRTLAAQLSLTRGLGRKAHVSRADAFARLKHNPRVFVLLRARPTIGVVAVRQLLGAAVLVAC